MAGNHKGGFGPVEHGTIDGGHEVSVAFGWGTKEGHSLIADGHQSNEQFFSPNGHDHYGPGDGPNNNGTSRGAYTGPAA